MFNFLSVSLGCSHQNSCIAGHSSPQIRKSSVFRIIPGEEIDCRHEVSPILGLSVDGNPGIISTPVGLGWAIHPSSERVLENPSNTHCRGPPKNPPSCVDHFPEPTKLCLLLCIWFVNPSNYRYIHEIHENNQ